MEMEKIYVLKRLATDKRIDFSTMNLSDNGLKCYMIMITDMSNNL